MRNFFENYGLAVMSSVMIGVMTLTASPVSQVISGGLQDNVSVMTAQSEDALDVADEALGIAKTPETVYVAYNSTTKELAFSSKEADLKDYDTQYGDISEEAYTSSSSVPWAAVAKDVVSVDIKREIIPKDTAYWFYNVGYNSMTELDLTNLNTENVTNMKYMFYYCGYKKLALLDLGDKFTLKQSTPTNSMFYNCGEKVSTKIYLRGFDVNNSSSKVDFYSMDNTDIVYVNTSKLQENIMSLSTSYRPSTWVIDKNVVVLCSDGTINHDYVEAEKIESTCTEEGSVTSVCSKCEKSKTVALEKKDHNYVNGVCTVCGCAPIYVAYDTTTNILGFSNNETDLASFSTKYGDIQGDEYTSFSQVPWYSVSKAVTTVKIYKEIKPTHTAYWFVYIGYNNMTSLDLTNLNTTNVTNMDYMFYSCGYNKLSNINLGSKFYTTNVTSMKYMFYLAGNYFYGRPTIKCGPLTINETVQANGNYTNMFARDGMADANVYVKDSATKTFIYNNWGKGHCKYCQIGVNTY